MIMYLYVTGNLYANIDFEKLRNEGFSETYNWERGVKLMPTVSIVMNLYQVIYLIMLPAYFLSSKVADYYIYLVVTYRLFIHTLPFDYT